MTRKLVTLLEQSRWKLERFAFPDDLRPALSRLRDRIIEKWDKEMSSQGAALSEVLQIRASADPDWTQTQSQCTSCSSLNPAVAQSDEPPEPTPATRRVVQISAIGRRDHRLGGVLDLIERAWLWARLVESWIGLCEPQGTIRDVTGEVVSQDEYTLDRYRDSSSLDMDYLSGDGDA